MQDAAAPRPAQAAIRIDLGAIFISLELSRSSSVITSLSPGAGEKMSKHTVAAGDVAGLLKRFGQLKEKARGRTGKDFPIIPPAASGSSRTGPREYATSVTALYTVGLDPAFGLLHENKDDRASLAYELMEPARPILDR
jgi:hypothetical protein